MDPPKADENMSSSDKIAQQIKIVLEVSQNSDMHHLNSKQMKIGNNFKCLVVNDEKCQLNMIEYLF